MHIRLGHMSKTDLKALMEKIKLKCEDFNCETFNFIRLTKHIPKIRTRQTSCMLELVFMDLFENRIESWNKERYYLVVVDDYTEHTFIYGLKTKNQVKNIVSKIWIPLAERQSGCKVLEIHSDNGGEFIDGESVEFIKSLGIIKRFNVAHNPHQNGVAERKIRTIKKKAELLLSNVPTEFVNKLYNEAVKYAVFLINFYPYSPQM